MTPLLVPAIPPMSVTVLTDSLPVMVLEGNIGKLDLIFLGGGVDRRAVVAAADNAKVISHDAADPVVAGDDAFGMAAVDDTGDGVDAGDAAHVIRAGNRAVKEAVLDFTGIVSGNAAHGAAASGQA